MFQTLYQLMRRYVEVRLQLIENHLQDELHQLFTKALIALIWLFLGSAGLLFVCFALAFALNEFLQSAFLGFLIIGCLFIFGLVIAILPTFRKKLMDKISNYFNSQKR
ncbi:MAG: phage holin family protein [Raineya sp.]|nr:phage holin family protein [Raineya sp.]MDW8296749.1 phage holin family protein [Raineya sp.]